MTDSEPKTDKLPQRLCSEIQLFDLCDLDSCKSRSDRFCTDSGLLGRFEKIAEKEVRTPEYFVSETDDEGNDGEGDEFAMDDFDGGEDDGWEDEE